ncbi:MAG: PP2C family protein-serine/threonine phosphatase [Bacteroidota bacterium]|nr:PP2C family protein-serine/threonine phosphatase [Bacteroidota bacterium]
MARLERIVERLELKEFQLRALLEVTKAINNNVDQAQLLKLYEGIVKEQLGITRLTLYVNSGGWQCMLAYGTAGATPEVDVSQVFGKFKDIQVIDSETLGSLGAFDVAVPVYHREKPLAFLLIGDIDEEQHRISPTVKHLNFIQTLTNLIVVAIENRRLARQELQQQRDDRELELAAEMQAMLIPRDLPKGNGVNAAGWYQPHRLVGGDYYDLFQIDENVIFLCVADVSGKGIAASLLMSNFQASLRALAKYSGGSLIDLVHDLNERVYANARGERFITLFLGRMDMHTRTFEFINSGHNDPLLHDAGKITSLHDGSIALGMMPKLPFLRSGSVQIPLAATLLCYTDGLIEQEDKDGGSFETGPLEKALLMNASKGPEAVIAGLRDAFTRHRGTMPYLDDIAVLTCTFG